ncbi:MAG: PIN domain-containing protein [Candidatus Kariarchaeaceae archaeon]|jgi:predicted nucleic-acid-binding protein
MNRIILDTTYILPLFGIDIDGVSNSQIEYLWSKGIENASLILSDISLLETLFKLQSDYRKKKEKMILQRYTQVLPTLLDNDYLTIYNTKLHMGAVDYANEIRDLGHGDYLDCLIAGTAMNLNGTFITEDNVLNKLLKGKFIDNIRIQDLNELLDGKKNSAT